MKTDSAAFACRRSGIGVPRRFGAGLSHFAGGVAPHTDTPTGDVPMTAFRHPRVLVDRARTATIRAAQALVVLLTMVLAVCAPVRAAPPDGLTATDWQGIQAQLPVRPMGWDTSGGALQQGKLIAGDAQTGDQLGYSVAVSGDTAVVGAPYEDGEGNTAGAAYVFVRSGGSWSQQAKLVAGDPQANDYFGVSVALDGDTAVVGAHYEDTGGANAGAAYVFVRSGGSWSQQAKLVAGDAQADDWFGWSVALDGDTALVGAPREDDGGSNAGAAYVFVRGGGVWSQQAKLVAGDAQLGDQLGWSVAFDGDTALVGANGEDGAGTDAGAAYVFVRSGASWEQQAKLMAVDAETNDQFGLSVALDGDTALVGAYGESAFAGAAYVFVRSGGGWSEQAKLVAGDAQSGDQFGWSVALDGDTALVGANGEDERGTDAGAAYVFVRNGGSWTQQTKLVAGDAQVSDWFGWSVALDGDTVLAGANGEDDGGSNAGAAYVFVPGHAVQAAVSGLAGTGLVLRNNGGDDLAIAADGSHAFATLLADGSPYAVTVATQPTNPPQTCTVSGGDNDDGSGTMAGAPV
ncbi:FG-GAP repeat protein, partial [Dokdonella fugitiva]